MKSYAYLKGQRYPNRKPSYHKTSLGGLVKVYSEHTRAAKNLASMRCVVLHDHIVYIECYVQPRTETSRTLSGCSWEIVLKENIATIVCFRAFCFLSTPKSNPVSFITVTTSALLRLGIDICHMPSNGRTQRCTFRFQTVLPSWMRIFFSFFHPTQAREYRV